MAVQIIRLLADSNKAVELLLNAPSISYSRIRTTDTKTGEVLADVTVENTELCEACHLLLKVLS